MIYHQYSESNIWMSPYTCRSSRAAEMLVFFMSGLVILIAIFFQIPQHQFLIPHRSVKLVQRTVYSVSLS